MGSLLKLQNICCGNGFREYLSKTFILQIMKNEIPGGKITYPMSHRWSERQDWNPFLLIWQTDQKEQTFKQFVLKVLLGTHVPLFLVTFCPLLFPYQYFQLKCTAQTLLCLSPPCSLSFILPQLHSSSYVYHCSFLLCKDFTNLLKIQRKSLREALCNTED